MTRNGLGILLLLLTGAFFWFWHRRTAPMLSTAVKMNQLLPQKPTLWVAPDSATIPHNDTGQLIIYGKKLIHETARYFGPQGSLGHNANGMNCQNCHLESGSRVWGGSFGSVASLYPRFSERRGSAETVNQRIADCFERSMNGQSPDSNSLEIKAMKAYILWVGQGVEKGKKPNGTGLEPISFLDRAADSARGRVVFMEKCQRCHGGDGQGKLDSLNPGYQYPPLWGVHSYNTGAGLYRLSKFAPFVKANMPFGTRFDQEQLTTEEAWDLAAFVNSQPRPVKKFKRDWPNILLKPVDLPQGPYSDSFSGFQHKYGPFPPIVQFKKDLASKSNKQ